MEFEIQVELVPSLQTIAHEHRIAPEQLSAVIAIEKDGALPRTVDRTRIGVTDARGKAAIATWEVDSLRDLFRGDRPAPMSQGGKPTEAQMAFLFTVEAQVLTLAATLQTPPRDDELIEVFSLLKRRPDSKSHGPLHDLLWQAVALALGRHPTSAAEYAALMGILERSARRWRTHAGSRGYVEFLEKTLGW